MIYRWEEKSRVIYTIHRGETPFHSDTDDSLQTEHETGPDSRWTFAGPKRWFQKQAEKKEIRKEKGNDDGGRKKG